MEILGLRQEVLGQPARLFAAFLAVAVVLLSPWPVEAQEVGDRVRVVLAGDTLIGQVTGMRRDGFELEMTHGDSRLVMRAEIRGLERAEVVGNYAEAYAGKGILGGGLAGVGVGGLLGVMGCLDSDSGCAGLFFFPTALGLAGAIVGAGVGAAVGAAIPREGWEAIPLGDAATKFLPQLGFWASQEGGVGLVLAGELRF